MTAQTILPANSVTASGYDVANSCRFDSASSADLRISDYSGAGTSRKTRTYSMWIKRSELSYAVIFGSAGKDHWVFTADHKIQINIGSGTDSRRITDMVFRDVSAWYHIVFAYDTTQGTAANRFTMWVNGAVATTSIVAGKNEVAEDEEALVFINGDTHTIGSDEDSASYFDGYMAEWVFVDGQKLDADSFGEYDSDSGIWKPKDVSGITLGTNGFYLNFADSSDLGIDAGNDNDFEPTNLTAIDQTTDTCTNNFATWNSLDNFWQVATFSEGNVKIITNSGKYTYSTSNIGVTSGKWYVEVKHTAHSEDDGNNYAEIGIASVLAVSATDYLGQAATNWRYYGDGTIRNNGSNSNYGNAYDVGDIIGIALNLDDNELKFYKNGTVQNSGTAIAITAAASTPIGAYFIAVNYYDGADTGTFEVNFGNPSFTGTDQADGNGFGSFEYAPPSGFLAICTKNLAENG